MYVYRRISHLFIELYSKLKKYQCAKFLLILDSSINRLIQFKVLSILQRKSSVEVWCIFHANVVHYSIKLQISFLEWSLSKGIIYIYIACHSSMLPLKIFPVCKGLFTGILCNANIFCGTILYRFLNIKNADTCV